MLGQSGQTGQPPLGGAVCVPFCPDPDLPAKEERPVAINFMQKYAKKKPGRPRKPTDEVKPRGRTKASKYTFKDGSPRYSYEDYMRMVTESGARWVVHGVPGRAPIMLLVLEAAADGHWRDAETLRREVERTRHCKPSASSATLQQAVKRGWLDAEEDPERPARPAYRKGGAPRPYLLYAITAAGIEAMKVRRRFVEDERRRMVEEMI